MSVLGLALAGVAPPERPASAPAEARNDTVFYVRDNGIGIEARHKDRVFGISKRLHARDA